MSRALVRRFASFLRLALGRDRLDGGDERADQEKDREDLAKTPVFVVGLDRELCL
jgi:hypothetical protein